jgi:hypothetical protein
MTTLSFFQATTSGRSKSAPKGSDLWIRNSVNAKTGVKVKYLAISRAFVEDRGFRIHGVHPKFSVHVAIDVPSRVLVPDITPEAAGGKDAILEFKGRSKTAYYFNSSALVDAIVNGWKLDTSADNHYFKLTRAGDFHQFARYTINQIQNHEKDS